MKKEKPMITYRPIGIIHSPFLKPEGTPVQPKGAEGIEGSVELLPEFTEGLLDIDAFSHLILIYHFHLAKAPTLKAKPFMDDIEHGIFAIRGPSRPNPIGISVVRLIRVNGGVLFIRDVDMVDGTPLLDIKPYVPEFDIHEVKSTGWLNRNVHKLKETKDDGRFSR